MNRKPLIAIVLALGLVIILTGSALGLVSKEWDNSSLIFTTSCDGNCDEITATVCNGTDSEDMAGTTAWELYWIASGNPRRGTVVTSGTINTLPAGECQTLIYDPSNNPISASGNYMFKAYQRPGHPGKGVLWSNACELVCEASPPTPTSTFTALIPPTPTLTFTPLIPPTPTSTFTPLIPPTPTSTFTPLIPPTPTSTFTPLSPPTPTSTFTPLSPSSLQ